MEKNTHHVRIKAQGGFKAVLSDMDGVFRTVPYPYIRDCVVRALEPYVANADELTLDQSAKLGSSDRFVNDGNSFLELVAYALEDGDKPLETLSRHSEHADFLSAYLEKQRKKQGPVIELAEMVDRFQTLRHGSAGQKTMKPIPAAMDGIRRLLENHWPACIVSNSPHASVQTWFSKQSIPLKNIVGADDVAMQKPHPECLWAACRLLDVTANPEVIYAGDLPNDVSAARAAGVASMGIAYPDHVNRLKKAKPDRVFDDFGKLADWLLESKDR